MFRQAMIAALASTFSVVGIGCGGKTGSLCGGSLNVPCPTGLFCQHLDGVCGGGTGVGICEPIPTFCFPIHLPVCGCDNITYENDCEAARVGVSTAHSGECAPAEQICGGIVGVQCLSGQYCKFDVGVCGESDQSGQCTPIPDSCVQTIDPVCGCDGNTYVNECEAAREAVSVASTGQCQLP